MAQIFEKGILIPKIRKNNSSCKWKDMQLGDSIFYESISKGYSASSALRSYSKRHGLGWKIRQANEGDGVRIWRYE